MLLLCNAVPRGAGRVSVSNFSNLIILTLHSAPTQLPGPQRHHQKTVANVWVMLPSASTRPVVAMMKAFFFPSLKQTTTCGSQAGLLGELSIYEIDKQKLVPTQKLDPNPISSFTQSLRKVRWQNNQQIGRCLCLSHTKISKMRKCKSFMHVACPSTSPTMCDAASLLLAPALPAAHPLLSPLLYHSVSHVRSHLDCWVCLGWGWRA